MAKYILLAGGAIASINGITILLLFKWKRIDLSLSLRFVFWFQVVTGLVFFITGLMK